MFEIALCVNDVDVRYLEKKLPRFRESVLSLDGIFNIYRESGNVYFLIASESNEQRFKTIVTNFICDCIMEDMKRRFILNNLDVGNLDSLKHYVLVEALVNFDRVCDVAYIKNRITLGNEFYISSFYAFRLNELKNKWGELLLVTNKSADFLDNDEIYLEVVKYLIEGIDIGEAITLEKINSVYIAKTSKDNVLCKINDRVALMNFLVRRNPKKITPIDIDDETLKIITDIFGGIIENN